MASALSIPHAVAALVLAVAGVAKLRHPRPAAVAVGLPELSIRMVAAGELILAVWTLVAAGPVNSGLMAAVYAGFAVLTLRLAGAGEACGCFGAEQTPASPLQSLLSAALSLVSLLSALAVAPGAGWILDRSAPTAAVLGAGIVAAVWGVVLSYSELPTLWRSWSPV